MPLAQNNNLSVWQDLAGPEFPPLTTDAATDVCIVGMGVAGLITAYLLLKNGFKVLILEKGTFGANETGRTAGHLSNILDEGLSKLTKMLGEKRARQAVASHSDAIDLIEKIILEEHINCGFKRIDGFLYLSPETDKDHLRAEAKAAQHLGLRDVELLSSPIHFAEFGPALKYPGQARIHSLQFLHGLLQAILRMGGQIYCKSPVIEFRDGELPAVRTLAGPMVYARHVMACTHMPVHQRLLTHTKESIWRTYMIAMEIPPEVFPDILMWDSSTPYHYLRKVPDFMPGKDLLLVGGEDHRITEDVYAEEKYENLHDWVLFNLGISGPIHSKWCGQTVESLDGLAYIGRNPGSRNIYISSADSGHGLTHGAITGMLLRDLIQGTPNEWVDLYSPARFQANYLNAAIANSMNALTHFRERNHQRKEAP